MSTLITVNRTFTLTALLDIESSDFAHWYELGIWWAMYGEGQGSGVYDDQYLFDTLIHHLHSGWYDDFSHGWFPMIGFNLGMLHGAMIDPMTCEVRTSASLLNLTDPDFTKGYWVGRAYYFTEAPLEGRHLTDTILCDTIHGWALEYKQWREPEAVLRYCLGCRIGELSGALIPAPIAVSVQ